MYKINKRGQSTVEYVLLVAAVIAVMIAFTTTASSPIRTTLNDSLTSAYDQVTTLTGRYTNAEPAAPANAFSPPSIINVDITK